MANHAASDVGQPARGTVVPVSWLRTIVTYLFVGVLLGLVVTWGIVVMIPVGFILILGAIPYTIIATVFILRERARARRALDEMQDFQVEMNLADFGGRSQRLSLVNGIVLGLLGLLLLATTANVSLLPDDTMVIMALIAMFSAIEIIVNAGWIYSSTTILAEEYALRTKTHSWKLILANRWLGWVIWYTGAGLAGFVLLTQPANFIFW